MLDERAQTARVKRYYCAGCWTRHDEPTLYVVQEMGGRGFRCEGCLIPYAPVHYPGELQAAEAAERARKKEAKKR